MQVKVATIAPLARAVPPEPPKGILKKRLPPASPVSAPMERVISQPFRPSASSDDFTDYRMPDGSESPYVASWLEAQKQREREWLCWHIRNEGLKPPQPMPLPTAGTVSRPGSPKLAEAPRYSEFDPKPTGWTRLLALLGCGVWGRRNRGTA